MDDIMEIKKQILNKIKEYEKIIIHRHFLPDGDALGSSFGLKDIIKQSFPDKQVYSVGTDTADYLKFLGEEDYIDSTTYNDALVIVVDTSNKSRINNDNYKLAKEIIKIDHHIETDPYGDINYVLPTVAATSLMIADFLISFPDELKISIDGARALYVGIITDTGRFRFRNVSGHSLKLAGHLLDYGFDTEDMFSNLYMKDVNVQRLQGYILKHFKTTKNGVNYIYISRRLQKKFKVSLTNASSLVNSMDSVKGSLIWILFVQDEKSKIRGRLRSRYMSINQLAEEFKGGGHAQASGIKFKNKSTIKKVIQRADEMIKEYKENNEGWN